MVLWPTRTFCPWDFPGKNTGVSCQFLLQGIFLTQGSNLHHLQVLLLWQVDSLPLSRLGISAHFSWLPNLLVSYPEINVKFCRNNIKNNNYFKNFCPMFLSTVPSHSGSSWFFPWVSGLHSNHHSRLSQYEVTPVPITSDTWIDPERERIKEEAESGWPGMGNHDQKYTSLSQEEEMTGFKL